MAVLLRLLGGLGFDGWLATCLAIHRRGFSTHSGRVPTITKHSEYQWLTAHWELLGWPKGLTQVALPAAVGSFERSLESRLRIRNGAAMVSEDFRKQALGYGLTTAHILYRRPDHRWLLQSYVWQNYDLFPEFPELHRFLAFWQEKLEGPLHSVRVAHCNLIKPAELKALDGEFRLQ
jgi:uncharacterized protein Usg